MSPGLCQLRALVKERLTAAAEEILELFERTIAEYEEEVTRNDRLQFLEAAFLPRVNLHKTGVQIVSVSKKRVGPNVDPPHIKEEPVLCIKQEEQLQEFPFTPVCLKTENYEEESCVFHQRPAERNGQETNGEDCGAEAGCSSETLTHLHSGIEEEQLKGGDCGADNGEEQLKGGDCGAEGEGDTIGLSEDWTQEQLLSKQCFVMVSTGSSVSDAGGQTKRFSCSECEKRFVRNAELRRHMLVHTGQKPFKCSLCERNFQQKHQLTVHMSVHTGEKRTYRCSVCDETFFKRKFLSEHKKTHPELNYIKCSECGKQFKQKGVLTRHMMIHTGQKPYKCSFCDREFGLKRSVLLHMRIHTGERPFPCSFCDKRFSNSFSLKTHMRLHTGERPYGCTVCSKAFIASDALKKHILLTHTEEKPFSCPVCNKGFMWRCHLKKHMKSHMTQLLNYFK